MERIPMFILLVALSTILSAEYIRGSENTESQWKAALAISILDIDFLGTGVSAGPEDIKETMQDTHKMSVTEREKIKKTIRDIGYCTLCNKYLKSASCHDHAFNHEDMKRYRCPKCTDAAFNTLRKLHRHFADGGCRHAESNYTYLNDENDEETRFMTKTTIRKVRATQDKIKKSKERKSNIDRTVIEEIDLSDKQIKDTINTIMKKRKCPHCDRQFKAKKITKFTAQRHVKGHLKSKKS